jgi:hypothetical protein
MTSARCSDIVRVVAQRSCTLFKPPSKVDERCHGCYLRRPPTTAAPVKVCPYALQHRVQVCAASTLTRRLALRDPSSATAAMMVVSALEPLAATGVAGAGAAADNFAIAVTAPAAGGTSTASAVCSGSAVNPASGTAKHVCAALPGRCRCLCLRHRRRRRSRCPAAVTK